jgi:vacuolar protein sorting-associated protein 13A/C
MYGNQSDLVNQLTTHYTQSLKGNIIRVAASMDLIGNPYNMISNMGRGVKNVYYEPKEGFMKGPLQGGLGLVKGAGGMLAVTGATTMGAIGKITGSVNKGIVAVSMDTDYIHDKEINDIQNKPENVLDGIG